MSGKKEIVEPTLGNFTIDFLLTRGQYFPN